MMVSSVVLKLQVVGCAVNRHTTWCIKIRGSVVS